MKQYIIVILEYIFYCFFFFFFFFDESKNGNEYYKIFIMKVRFFHEYCIVKKINLFLIILEIFWYNIKIIYVYNIL